MCDLAQFIEGTLDWSDNSSGVAAETGQEIQIYTDSPSFVPDVPIDYTEAPNPWMRLPFVNAGVTTAGFKLETPVTFIVVRVRQFNADGNGEWSNPQGSRFSITQVSGVNRPPAPTNVGFAVVGTGTITPPPPPPDLPPPPPPTGGGGSSSNYSFTAQFSGVQGQSGWSYLDGAGNQLTYDSANSIWRGDELYLAIWNGGFRHSSSGTIKDAVARWTAPSAGTALVSGTAQLFSAPGSVRFVAKHNATTKFTSTDMTTTTAEPYSFTAVMSAGDTLDFISQRVSTTVYNNNLRLDPVISFTTDGTTPANPVVGSVSPSSATVTVGGAQTLTITLTSAPGSNVSVAMSSSDVTKATVPATVTVPAGQTSALVTVTGIAAGSSTITATYNSISKTSAITVANPSTSAWPNAIVGGTVLADVNCQNNPDTYPKFFDVYGSTIIGASASDATAPMSPPTCWKARLEALATYGGNQLEFSTLPTRYREMSLGITWRTNPQFQGRVATNKLWLLGGYDTMGGFFLFGSSKLVGGQAPLLWTLNTDGISNAHLVGSSDPGALFYPNVGNGTVSVGVWYKFEAYIKASTTRTSRDGDLKWWINGVLVGSYPGLNYCGPNGETLDRFAWTQTWDGAFDMGISNTQAWEHWIDHIYIVGKN